MTNKILTPAEALRALAGGKKIIHVLRTTYCHLKEGQLVNQTGEEYDLSNLEHYSLYTEPKSKVVWVEYLFFKHGSKTRGRY